MGLRKLLVCVITLVCERWPIPPPPPPSSQQELNSRAQGEVSIREALRELELWGAGAVFSLTAYSDSSGKELSIIKDWKDLVNQVPAPAWTSVIPPFLPQPPTPPSLPLPLSPPPPVQYIQFPDAAILARAETNGFFMWLYRRSAIINACSSHWRTHRTTRASRTKPLCGKCGSLTWTSTCTTWTRSRGSGSTSSRSLAGGRFPESKAGSRGSTRTSGQWLFRRFFIPVSLCFTRASPPFSPRSILVFAAFHPRLHHVPPAFLTAPLGWLSCKVYRSPCVRPSVRSTLFRQG